MEEEMKSNLGTCIIALTLFAAPAIPVQLAAQNQQDHPHQYHHYQLIDLGTFGGPNSGQLRAIPKRHQQ
jgi:hypothetical protein